jgi:hypothetical protein
MSWGRQVTNLRKHLVCAVLALLTLGSTSAWAELIYTVRQCTVADPCDVGAGPHGGTPPAHYLNGLDNNLFVAYFELNLPGAGVTSSSVFGFQIRGSNSSGYIYGHVLGPNLIDTQFIFHAGQLLCCTIDEPYVINDLNDNNLLVGNSVYGTLGPIFPGFIGTPGSGNQAPQFPYELTPDALAFLPGRLSTAFRH